MFAPLVYCKIFFIFLFATLTYSLPMMKRTSVLDPLLYDSHLTGYWIPFLSRSVVHFPLRCLNHRLVVKIVFRCCSVMRCGIMDWLCLFRCRLRSFLHPWIFGIHHIVDISQIVIIHKEPWQCERCFSDTLLD